MAIRSSIYFTFNGQRSDDFGIVNVNMESGMLSEPFAAGRSIRKQRVRGRDRGYFQEIELEELKFTVTFAWRTGWENEEKLREVARWLLSPKYYAPLVFADEPDKIYYCLCVDSPELIHNSLKQGYVRLNFECCDAYAYTPVYEQVFDLSNNPVGGTIIELENIGDAECKPIVSIYKVGGGDVTIRNQSNGNAEMTLVQLVDKETVDIDCENRLIKTDLPLTYRYDKLRGDYLILSIFDNKLLVQGSCRLKFVYQFKRLQ